MLFIFFLLKYSLASSPLIFGKLSNKLKCLPINEKPLLSYLAIYKNACIFNFWYIGIEFVQLCSEYIQLILLKNIELLFRLSVIIILLKINLIYLVYHIHIKLFEIFRESLLVYLRNFFEHAFKNLARC